MATVIISQLPPPPNETGTAASKGTDLFPATDITNISTSPTGQTNKYTLSEIFNWMLSAQGLVTYQACRVATTASLSATYANGASGVGATLTNNSTLVPLVIDGVTMLAGDRVLVWQQAAPADNGIYFVSNNGSTSSAWVLTRATDYNTPAKIVQNGVVTVNQGTTYAGILFQETAAGPFTIGTSPITFVEYSIAGVTYPISLANGGTGQALSSVNSAVFSTTIAGDAQLSATLPTGLIIPGYADSGVNTNITSMSGLTGAIEAPTQINDANGSPVVSFNISGNIPNAVNFINIANEPTGSSPGIAANGSDTNVGLSFATKGTGMYQFLTAATSSQYFFYTGTGYNVANTFSFSNTPGSYVYSWPARTGTVLLTTGAQQLAAAASILLDKGTGIESSNAVTINKQSGVITTTSLTTAQYGTEVITLTNSEIAATSVVIVSVMGGSNTTPGISVSATAASTSSVITITNLNSASLNGTVIIGFAVF